MKFKAVALLIFISSAFVDVASSRNVFVLNKSEKEKSSSSPKQKPLVEDSNTAKKFNAEVNRLIDAGAYMEAEALADQSLALSQKINYQQGIADIYIHFGTLFFFKSNYPTALGYYNKALAINESLRNRLGVAESYSNIGKIYLYTGEYDRAYEFFKPALQIQEELGDKKGLAKIYSNIGEVFDNQSKYPAALESYLKSLKLYEELKDKAGISACYSYIALVYNAEASYPEALKNQFASLTLQKELGDTNGVALSHNNLGMIYFRMGNYDEALRNHLEALRIREKIGDKKGIADSYYFIADSYRIKGNYPDALKYHLNALKIEIEIGYNLGIADSYIDIGNVLILQKNYREALDYLNKGLAKAKEMDLKDDLKKGYSGLSEAYAGLRNYESAYKYHKLFMEVKDTIMNNENTKKVTEMRMEYAQEGKDRIAQEREKAKEEQRKVQHDREVIIRDSFIGGFAVVLFFAGIFFRQRNRISNEKKRSDELLLNILPEDTAEELKETGGAKTKTYEMVSVMFTDFKNFTKASEKLSPEDLVKEIHECYSGFDRIIAKYNIEKIKTIGDSYMCAGGLPAANTTNPIDVVSAALEIRDFMLARKLATPLARADSAFEIRIGVHTGPVVAGIVGIKKFAYDIWGDTVNLASRMESSGEVGKVNVSGSTFEFINNKFTCIHRGKISAKNKGEVDMYFVEARS